MYYGEIRNLSLSVTGGGTHSIRTNPDEDVRHLNGDWLALFQHAERYHGHRPCFGLGKDEASKEQTTHNQCSKNNCAIPVVLIPSQAKSQRLGHQAHDQKRGSGEIKVLQG